MPDDSPPRISRPLGDYRAERAARAAREQNAEEFREYARTIEAMWEWLGDFWDDCRDECDAEQRDRAEIIAAGLETLLAPYSADIIAYHKRTRAEYTRKGLGPLRDLKLFGETLPAVRS